MTQTTRDKIFGKKIEMKTFEVKEWGDEGVLIGIKPNVRTFNLFLKTFENMDIEAIENLNIAAFDTERIVKFLIEVLYDPNHEDKKLFTKADLNSVLDISTAGTIFEIFEFVASNIQDEEKTVVEAGK